VKRTNRDEKGECLGQVERRSESEEDKWRGEGKVKRTSGEEEGKMKRTNGEEEGKRREKLDRREEGKKGGQIEVVK
jgi:hypothetical protein